MWGGLRGIGGERRDVSLQQVGRHPWLFFSPSSLFLGECKCASNSVPSRQPSDTLESRGKAGRGICGTETPTLPLLEMKSQMLFRREGTLPDISESPESLRVSG